MRDAGCGSRDSVWSCEHRSPARVRHHALVAGEPATFEFRARGRRRLSARELGRRNGHANPAFDEIDLDDVTISDATDRSALGCFRRHVADAQTARATGETAVGDEGDVGAEWHALE